MKPTVLLIAALAIAPLVATPAFAGNNKAKGYSAVVGCPPGLAKKNPPCIPPGQAKKYGYTARYEPGERILRDYRIIRDAGRYGLSRDDVYYMVGREIFRMDPDTRRVIAFIGLADALLN
jgi:hypothetical protein